MNQATAKATRRDIRKAFGPEAIELLNRQSEAVNFTSATVQNLVLRVAELEGRVERLEVRQISHGGEWHGRLAILEGVSMRDFWGRLRWLFTGC